MKQILLAVCLGISANASLAHADTQTLVRCTLPDPYHRDYNDYEVTIQTADDLPGQIFIAVFYNAFLGRLNLENTRVTQENAGSSYADKDTGGSIVRLDIDNDRMGTLHLAHGRDGNPLVLEHMSCPHL